MEKTILSAAFLLSGIIINAQNMDNVLSSRRQGLAIIAADELGDDHTPVQTVDFSVWPKGEPNSAYAQFFTGNSYLAQLDGGVANVTFEPGCRNNWHIHHKQVQVLICVAGRGWYQEWGKPAVQLVPGTIIEIPEGVKHWHGAAADSWMQHLTFHKDVQEGASNEWLEPVNDEQYQKVR
nr:4-carboxymuconolactone decarboxylase (EC [uncultured bacterium]